ncbi:hypothetical protein [Methanoregula sp. UBA64]|jgi:hypothetical protein|uniref:hypothetical protein n=1 Tax=Methanoregula sp. UBA64 TaxID=1915554 RepID=UPI0025F5F743|nr:hypothetical protein [Methanoregula sp. UBA64]
MTDPCDPKTTGTVSFKSVARIYDSDDTSPEAHRDLADTAESRILHAALAVPKGRHADIFDRLEIVVPDLAPGEDAAVVSAIREHFLRRAGEVRDQTRLTVRTGLRECRLTVAVCVPSFIGIGICSQFKGDPLIEILANVLVIFCWVTIWQPFQSLVFDRWTQKVTAQIYQKIAGMPIEVRAG